MVETKDGIALAIYIHHPEKKGLMKPLKVLRTIEVSKSCSEKVRNIVEVLYINHPHQMNREELPPLAMAFGYFDGVHLGHQKVIKWSKKSSREMGLKSAVMSFNPHPSVVLGKTKKVEHIKSA